jgi:hypothetical protein
MNPRALVVATFPVLALCGAACADINGFGTLDPSVWRLNIGDQASAPSYNPSTGTLQLTNPGTGERRSVFALERQTVAGFTASFTYNAQNIVSHFGETFGACFVLQNSPAGASAFGGHTAGLGYSGIGNSVAVSLAIGGSNGTSGVFTNGVVGSGATATSPVSLASGHPIHVSLSYDGVFLTQMLTDTVTNQTFTPASFIINIPAVVGGSLAYVGITASTVGINQGGGADQYFSDFQFTAVPAPSSAALLAVGGACAARRRRG